MNLWEVPMCSGLSPLAAHMTNKVQIHLGVTRNMVPLPTDSILGNFSMDFN